MHFHSPAKINLFLKVVSKQQNNYHNLQSFFVLLNLADSITISRSEQNIVEMDKKISTQNIIIKALNFLEKYFKIHDKYHIRIKKNIPISAGLGGGSSNAATIIKAICQMHNIKITPDDLTHIAYNIGADIPFFIIQQNALVEGIGEKITPYSLSHKLLILLVNPGVEIATRLIFQNHTQKFSSQINYTPEKLLHSCLNAENDLKITILKFHPELDEILTILKALKNNTTVGISGTGATCFAIFKDSGSLRNAYQFIKSRYPNFWVYFEEINI